MIRLREGTVAALNQACFRAGRLPRFGPHDLGAVLHHSGAVNRIFHGPMPSIGRPLITVQVAAPLLSCSADVMGPALNISPEPQPAGNAVMLLHCHGSAGSPWDGVGIPIGPAGPGAGDGQSLAAAAAASGGFPSGGSAGFRASINAGGSYVFGGGSDYGKRNGRSGPSWQLRRRASWAEPPRPVISIGWRCRG